MTSCLASEIHFLNFLQSRVSCSFESILTLVNLKAFYTCSAVVFALLAALITRYNQRLKADYRFQYGKIVIPTPLYEDSSDEEDDESENESEYSELSSSEEEEEELEHELRFANSFKVAGSDRLKMSSSWSDFVNGRNVVKSWEELGLGIEKASESLISLWDSDKFNNFNSNTKYQIPVLSMPSPSVIVSAGITTGKNVALRVFDTRLRRQIPQIFAEWQPCRRKVAGEDSGETADVGEVVIRDLRKLEVSPLEKLTENDVLRTWTDNGAVVMDGNREISGLGNDNGSVVLRCRNAVFSSLL